MSDGRIYEGQTFVFGMDMDTDPSALKPNVVSKAINRIFRGGKNRTRPPFIHKELVFDNPEEEEIFKHGNFQGCIAYKKKRPGRFDGIVVSIAGYIFFISLVNERFICKLIFYGNNPRLMHTWFCQAEDWLYIQNGEDPAVFWDGQIFGEVGPRQSRGSQNGEMPVGTIMAYAHGRVFVSNAFDQIAASDIIYGTGFTKTSNTQKFTENTYWAEGGNFGMPTDLGHITGMIVVPRQGRDLRGQGELLILGENGAQAIEASVPRQNWHDAQIQAVTMTGRGCVAPGSLISVNNQVMFRSSDGISLYGALRTDQNESLSFGKISRDVNNWFDEDTQEMMQFCSSIYFDNRVLTTVSPFQSQPSKLDYGNHRYNRGMIALDLDKASGVEYDTNNKWDGLWTGIRPTALIEGRFNSAHRAFAFSFDSDGENRIYEITRKGLNDELDGTGKQIEWSYVSKRFDWTGTKASNSFEVKRLVGGELWMSELRDRVAVDASYRPDHNPCWSNLIHELQAGSTLGDDWAFSTPRYKRVKFLSPQQQCLPGADYPSNHGSQHQIRIFGKGSVRIDRMRVAMAAVNDPNSPVGSCPEGFDDPKTAIDCAEENDYSYSIVSS